MDMVPNGAFQLGGRGIRFIDITDGQSNTILVGEKHVALNQFGLGWNDCSQYNGDYPSCSTRGGGVGMELAASPHDPGWRFGSYHPGLCQFALADGSVQRISVSISPVTLGLLVSINDGEPVPDY